MEQQESSSLGESPEIARLAGLLEKMIHLQLGRNVAHSRHAPVTRALLRAFLKDHNQLIMPQEMAVQLLEWQCSHGGHYAWEAFAVLWGYILLRNKERSMARALACQALGYILSHQLFIGDTKSVEAIAQGLRNLRTSRHFGHKQGRKSQGILILVAVAFSILKEEKKIDQPSQREVIKYLKSQGFTVSTKATSTAFEELGLKDASSDARLAQSAAGQRRRKTEFSN